MKPPKKPKPLWLGAVFVVIGVAILLVLGAWQLQRLKWKEGLLAHIAALQSAPAVPLAAVANRPAANLDFVRVSLACPLRKAALSPLSLYSVWDGDPGVRWIVACKIPASNRSVLVDLGFLAAEAAQPLGPKPLSPVARDETIQVVGVMRVPEGANPFTPANPALGTSQNAPPSKDAPLWYWRDVPAMAAQLGAANPLPVVLMVEKPALGDGYPKPAPIPKDIPNNHLDYALTWYGLAAALVGVYIAMLLRRRTAR